jgi:hypothetical protein
MRVRMLLLISLFLMANSGWLQATKIAIKDRQLYVNDRPFVVKGVCYSGIPVGQTYNYVWEKDTQDLNMDFPLIRAMGGNCIRTYNTFNNSTALDAAYRNGLYTIIELPVPWGVSFSNNQSDRTNVITNAYNMIQKWKTHPGVLMWCIGHEVQNNAVVSNKLNSIFTNRVRSWFRLLNEVAGRIHQWEAPYWHPVTYGEGVANVTNFGNWMGATTVGNPIFESDDPHMTNLDIWGAQYYPGGMFEPTFFSRYNNLSSKPLWIAETGCDAFDMNTHLENQFMQELYVTNQWRDIKNNLSGEGGNRPCVGVTFFNWDDGWWKASGSPWVHDTNAGWQNPSYYDWTVGHNNMNEEWWGFVSIAQGTYQRGFRQVYYSIQKKWTTGNEGKELQNFLFRKQSVNVPNPFNISTGDNTDIWVYLNQSSEVTASIYDYSGKLIKKLDNAAEYPGYLYTIKWDGKDENSRKVQTGLYLCKVKAKYKISNTSQQETQLIKIAVVK